MAMDSFSKRRPPKFSEPIDFNIKSNDYSNLLVDRFSGLFSSGWSNNDQNGMFNFSGNLNTPSGDSVTNSMNNNPGTIGSGGTIGHGGLYSSNLTHTFNGINSNPFSTKGLNSYDYGNQWTAPPRSCPPIGIRDPFNSFSITPRNHANSNHLPNNQIHSQNYSNLNSVNQLNRDNLNNISNGHHQLTGPNNTNNAYGIGNQHHGMANNSSRNSMGMNSDLNALQASYVPPRVRRRNPTCTECVFCKNNGQPPSFYKSHILKCPEGKIVCPVLRDYDCPICHNGGGPTAHTIRYCPWNKPSFWQRNSRP